MPPALDLQKHTFHTAYFSLLKELLPATATDLCFLDHLLIASIWKLH